MSKPPLHTPTAADVALYTDLCAQLRRTLANLETLVAEQRQGVVTPEEADICLQVLALDLQPLVAALTAWRQAAHPEEESHV